MSCNCKIIVIFDKSFVLTYFKDDKKENFEFSQSLMKAKTL